MSTPSHTFNFVPQSGDFHVFPHAPNWTVNDLRITNAQTVNNNNYVTVHKAAGSRPIDLAQLLNPLYDASHKRNRTRAPPDSQCLPGTRSGLLDRLRLWIKTGSMGGILPTHGDTGVNLECDKAGRSDRSGMIEDAPLVHEGWQRKPICWMYGSFGCGKSAIAQTIAEDFGRRKQLAASFFFFRGAGDRSDITRFANTLAHQVALNVPGARKFIERAVVQDPGLAHSTYSLDTQFEKLVFEPLLACLKGGDDPYLIVVDGLDECADKEGIARFIELAISFFTRHPDIPLRLLITSRVEEHIRTHVEEGHTIMHLLNLAAQSSARDIQHFLQVSFANARKRNRALQTLPEMWPTEQDLNKLVNYCDGSFIFGSTLANFIILGLGDRDPRTPMERLPLALEISPGIDAVYANILSRAQHLPHFLTIVPTIAYLETPLSISAISVLLGLSAHDVLRILLLLQAVLHVPGRDDLPITFFHTSLREFLVDKNRCGSLHSPGHHTFLVHRCLDVLFGKEPTRNIECNKYAVVYWSKHLNKAALTKGDELFTGSTPIFDYHDPYRPIDIESFGRNEWRSFSGEERQVVITLSSYENGTVFRNLRQLGLTLGLSKTPKIDSDQRNASNLRAQPAPARWSGTIGLTGELKSRQICSLKDIVEGLYAWTMNQSQVLRMKLWMKRGSGVSIVLSSMSGGGWDAGSTRDISEITYFINRYSE